MLGLLASIEPMGYLHLFEIDMEVLHNFVMLRVEGILVRGRVLGRGSFVSLRATGITSPMAPCSLCVSL